MSNLRSEGAPIVEGTPPLRSAYEVIADVVQSNPAIEFLSLVTYEEGPNWREVGHADKPADVPLLLKGLQQDRGKRTFTKLSGLEVSADKLHSIATSLSSNQLLAAVSRVGIRGGSAHIPMMDFICPPSTLNTDLLVHLIKELRQGRGCLLESGRSYHYYGFRLLDEEGWRIFLGKCLLMSGYTDDRYIGHQLVDGHCVLRLSSAKLRTTIPRVVAELS